MLSETIGQREPRNQGDTPLPIDYRTRFRDTVEELNKVCSIVEEAQKVLSQHESRTALSKKFISKITYAKSMFEHLLGQASLLNGLRSVQESDPERRFLELIDNQAGLIGGFDSILKMIDIIMDRKESYNQLVDEIISHLSFIAKAIILLRGQAISTGEVKKAGHSFDGEMRI